MDIDNFTGNSLIILVNASADGRYKAYFLCFSTIGLVSNKAIISNNEAKALNKTEKNMAAPR